MKNIFSAYFQVNTLFTKGDIMKKTKRLNIYVLLLLVLILSVSFFSGCESTNLENSFLDTSEIEATKYEYDSVNNKTKIIWTTTLTNNTIYNFSGFSVTFKLYDNTNTPTTQTYNYEKSVNHSSKYTGKFNFEADGKITSIEYVSWTAHYDTFWDTYKIWIIITSVVAGIITLIYIIVMILQDLELDDTTDAIVDFFEEHVWVAFIFLIPLAGTIWGIVSSYWVPVLIILGGIVAVVLLSLIAHLIKYIVEEISFGIGGAYVSDNDDDYEDDELDDEDEDFDEDDFDPDIEDVADYIDDGDTLMLFNISQLKEYCRENGIKYHSPVSKSDLVDLIVDSSDDDVVKPAKGKAKQKDTNLRKQSSITFDDIAGLEEAKNAFREKVVLAFKHKELYEQYGKKVGGGLLLYGLPGTGKTMFAEAASNETDSLFIPIKCSDIKSKWYGESEAKVKSIFEKARKAKKAIIFFDEFEAIGAKRTDNSENGNNDLVPQILAEMQGIGSNNKNCVIVVIAATNKPWAIDSAFLRPGRFDDKIYIPLPDTTARKKLFELKLKSIPQENLNYDYLASITDGFNGADIGAFCDKLKMLAINKSIESKKHCPITMGDVEQVKKSIKSSVSDEDIRQLLEFKNTYS